MRRAAAGGRPVAAGPVLMVGAAFHQAIDVRIRVLAEHPHEVSPGHDVKNVLDDAVGDEQLAPLVPVDPPGVRRAVGIDLELVPHGMIAPHAAAHFLPLLGRRPRLADQRGRGDAVAAVEPAVRPPGQIADDVVLGFERPAVEQNFGRAVGLVVAVGIGNEDQVRCSSEPHAAEADFDAAEIRRRCRETRSACRAGRRRRCLPGS